MVFLNGFGICDAFAVKWWGYQLPKCWLWYRRSRRRLWEKHIRTRSFCHLIFVPRRPELSEGASPSIRYLLFGSLQWFPVLGFCYILVMFNIWAFCSGLYYGFVWCMTWDSLFDIYNVVENVSEKNFLY